MDQEQEKNIQTNEAEDQPVQKEPEENVVSVWHGSGNTKWFRRRHLGCPPSPLVRLSFWLCAKMTRCDFSHP